jgi:hypothetical protein
LVLNLHRAAMENRKEQIKVNVLGLSVAVMNVLDAAFGGGKGKILDNWLKAIDGPGDSREGRRPSLSPNTRAFFSGAPVVTQKE